MRFNNRNLFFILLLYFSFVIKTNAQKDVTASFTTKNIVIDGKEDDEV